MRATFGGEHVALKWLGPDASSMAAYHRELDMLLAMAPMDDLPAARLLAWGHYMAGVHFIATHYIDGTPLSELAVIPAAVAEAAETALKELQQRLHGFLHGDIRLANVMLCAAGRDFQPRCMFVDFARSRVDGSSAQQRAELASLNTLTGRRAC
jgi:RIO-like serine/threonine protein kinase